MLDLLLRLRCRGGGGGGGGGAGGGGGDGGDALSTRPPNVLPPSVVRRHAETLVALAATEHAINRGASPALAACGCLWAACAGLARTEAQRAEAERMLAELAFLSGIPEGEIVRVAEALEEAMNARMPTASVPTKAQQNSSHPSSSAHQVASAVVHSSSSPNPSTSSSSQCIAATAASPNPPPSSSPTDLVEMSVACVY